MGALEFLRVETRLVFATLPGARRLADQAKSWTSGHGNRARVWFSSPVCGSWNSERLDSTHSHWGSLFFTAAKAQLRIVFCGGSVRRRSQESSCIIPDIPRYPPRVEMMLTLSLKLAKRHKNASIWGIIADDVDDVLLCFPSPFVLRLPARFIGRVFRQNRTRIIKKNLRTARIKYSCRIAQCR